MMQKKNFRFTRALAFVVAIFMIAGAFPASARSTDKTEARSQRGKKGASAKSTDKPSEYVILRNGRRVEGTRIEMSDSRGMIILKTRQGSELFRREEYVQTSLDPPRKMTNVIKRLCWFDPAAETVWEEIIQSSKRRSLAPRLKGVDAAQAEKQLEAFGTRSMPNAYAQYRETRTKVEEVKRMLLENFPQGLASDPTDGTMFAKAYKNLAVAVARVFRRRDELCFFLLFHQMGLFSDEMLTKYDSRPIHLRLAAESSDWPDDTPAVDTALAAEDATFAAQHLPGTHAGYQRLCGLFDAGAKQYADLRRTALALDATRARLELKMLKYRLESIQEVLLQNKKDFAVKRLEFGLGEATAESLAALDQSNTATIQEFERSMGVKAYVAQYAIGFFITLPRGVAMEMIWCPPGTFLMGSPENKEGRERRDNETQHRVTLTKGFWMAKYEVTQKQWKSVMGENPSAHTGDDALPVENVFWTECMEFCRKTGLQLPTEAQWEYACRAGSTGPYAGTGKLEDMGWYGDNSGYETHIVGQKRPNAWGLYDMHGNVREWCQDLYGAYPSGAATDPAGADNAWDNIGVVRGGSWNYRAAACRSASRDGSNGRERDLGFRPVMVPAE